MKHWTFATTTAVAALMIGQTAFAQVTPEDVWQSWQDMGAAMGQIMTAESEERDGDTLTVTNVAIALDDGQGLTVNGTMDEVSFTDNGDGTVEVITAESYPLTMTVPATPGVDGAKAATVAIEVAQPGMVMTASGTPDALSYDVTAPELTVTIAATPEGATAEEFSMALTLTNVAGGYLLGGDDTATTLESNLTAEAMAISGEGTDSTTGEALTFDASMADIVMDQTGNFLGAEAMVNMAQALKDGFATDGSLSFAAMTFAIEGMSEGAPMKVATTADTGAFDFAMGADGLDYAVNTTGTAMTVAGGGIPFPELTIAYGEAGFDFSMPILASETPADFALLMKVVDLTVSDEVWAMADPTNQLPRDPATIIVDTKGSAKLSVDIMDEAAMATLGEAAPGELNALEVTQLQASIAGAELTGKGAFTFDNTDMTTFEGMPAPTGTMDLSLTGGNGLLDKLVAMGLLPEDQVMGVRMMMGMFAVPATDGSDGLTTTIEFKDKMLMVNGQPMPM